MDANADWEHPHALHPVDDRPGCPHCGGCAFLGHPAFPTWVARLRPASIWATRTIRLLRRLACAQVLTFDQCVFDCAAPTTLMLIRLPWFVEHTRKLGPAGRCLHARDFHQALGGPSANGEFRTAIAKVHPTALNAALAVAVADYVLCSGLDLQRVDPLPEDVLPLISYDFVADTVVQPDYYVPG